MKTIVAIALVAFCAVLQVVFVQGSLENQLETLNKRINVVQGTLNLVRKLQYVDVFPRVLDLAKYGQSNITLMIESRYNETIDEVEELVRNSTAAGKDPATCKETATSRFQTLRTNITDSFITCVRMANKWLNNVGDALDSNIEEAVKILSQLNLIFTSCYGPDTEALESCVVQTLANVTETVELYRQSTLVAVETMGNWDVLQNQVEACVDEPQNTMSLNWNATKSNLEECLAAL